MPCLPGIHFALLPDPILLSGQTKSNDRLSMRRRIVKEIDVRENELPVKGGGLASPAHTGTLWLLSSRARFRAACSIHSLPGSA